MKRQHQRHFSIEPLEPRRFLAAASFALELYESSGNGVGGRLDAEQIEIGKSFYVNVLGVEHDPLLEGIGAVSLNLQWDPRYIQLIENDFDLAKILTNDLPLFRQGTFDQDAGRIYNLSAAQIDTLGFGHPIGNGEADSVAMLHFVALGEIDQTELSVWEGPSGIYPVPYTRWQRSDITFEPITLAVVGTVPTLDAHESPPAVADQAILQTSAPLASGLSPTVGLDVFLTNVNTVKTGDTLLVTVRVEDLRPIALGVSGLSVDLSWDPSVLELIPPISGRLGDVVCDQLPLFKDGTLDVKTGTIKNLNGSALPAAGVGAAIGRGHPDLFAELQFRAVLAASTNTMITASPGSGGAGLIGADSAIVSSTATTLVVIAESETPRIAIELSDDRPDHVTFGTRDALGNLLSELVRPAHPDVSQSITIRNLGSGNLVISRIDVLAPDVHIDIDGAVTIPAGESQLIRLRYAPNGDSPLRWRPKWFALETGLIIHSNATNQPTLDIGLSGKSTFDADVNYDGKVDLADVSRYNNHYGKRASQSEYFVGNDPNGDGSIDLGDLGVLNAQYGKQVLATAEKPPMNTSDTTVSGSQTTFQSVITANAPQIANQPDDDEFDQLIEELARNQLGV